MMVAARQPSNCSLHNELQGLVLVISLLLDQVWKLLNAANLSIDSTDEHRCTSRMVMDEHRCISWKILPPLEPRIHAK
jgi:hypothetical protein